MKIGKFLPDTGDGFNSIPARWHSHVDKGDSVRRAFGTGGTDFLQAFLSLESGVDPEILCVRGTSLVAEKRGFRRIKLFGELGISGAEDFAKIFMDRGVVVDDKDALIGGLQSWRCEVHVTDAVDAMGSSRVKLAPWPMPGLATVIDPPIERAAIAPLCRPKPWPPSRVVKPCAKIRVKFSGEMPMPLSETTIWIQRTFGAEIEITIFLSMRSTSSKAYLALRIILMRICNTLCRSTRIGGAAENCRSTSTP